MSGNRQTERNLVTVFNYREQDQRANELLRVWLHQINLYAGGFNVYVIVGDNNFSIQTENYISKCNNINVIKVSGSYNPHKYNVPDLDDNFHINFNAYNVFTFGKKINQPIIYMDLDAILFHNLHDWWEHIHDKPFIGFPHLPLSTKLNAGVYSISDWNFISFDKLVDRFFKNRKNYRNIMDMCRTSEVNYADVYSVFESDGRLRKSGDQALIVNYFLDTPHTPYCDTVDAGWNYWGLDHELNKEHGTWKPCKAREVDVKILHFYAQARPSLTRSDFYIETSNRVTNL